MHRFWDTIIQPILECVQPTSIVEIGSDQGKNTRNLLEFCTQHGATLHAIDPLPKFDVAAWQEQYGEHFVFHQSLSLNAIPKIDRFEIVLIDGDHNWYTVSHELKLIEKRCADLSHPFPLIFLHDIGWPYGRRDLYYNPENIPDAYRQPYQKKGIRPDVAELQEKGGLNAPLCNAIYEHNLQNGVLTAVEDFLQESQQNLHLTQLPGLHGLGVLIPVQLLEQHQDLEQLLNTLQISPVVGRYIERIEDERIQLEIVRHEQRAALMQLDAQRVEAERLRRALDEQTAALQAQEAEVEGLRGRLQEQIAAVRQAKDTESAKLQRALEEQTAALQAQEAETSTLRQQLTASDGALSATQQELAAVANELAQVHQMMQDERKRTEVEVAALHQRVTELERTLSEKDRQLSMYKGEVKQRARDIAQLESWIGQLDRGFISVVNSKRWKLDHTLGSLYRKLRFKPPMPMPRDYWHDIMERFEAWKRSFENRSKGEEKTHGKLEVPASSSLNSQAYVQEPKKKAATLLGMGNRPNIAAESVSKKSVFVLRQAQHERRIFNEFNP